MVLSALLVFLLQSQSLQPDVAEEIRRRVELLREGSTLVLAGGAIGPAARLPALYENRAFAPLWTDPAVAADLVRAVREVADDGLDPHDYHLNALESLPLTHLSIAAAAEADLLRSYVLARLAHDLRFGRVNPTSLQQSWRIPARPDTLATGVLQAMVTAGHLHSALESLKPSHFIYLGMKRALASYRAIATRGAWPLLPAGPTLQMDSTGPRVAQLRRRLAIEGDLISTDTISAVFDSTLDAAVRLFQHRHALNEDGMVGASTLRELNVPIEARIDQIRINLERARWVLDGLADTFVAVNVAGQRAYLVKDRKVVWETRVIVGKTYTRTPVFAAPMRYIVLNPTWTVPPGIVGEVISAIRRNPGYLQKERMRVLDRTGRAVNPSTIDFAHTSARSFPYTFRQDAGPENALGKIKFVFPNDNNVYLHDTPARTLFEREDRTFSHGCIRVQDPLRLGELILGDQLGWSRADLEAAIATGKTQIVNLATPIPVLILYWTASTDLHGEVHFYRDVYERDARLLRALDGS
jgi:murein L,D-transpeptidase YcbB/YkuD